jgi:hypothetical protein
LIIRKPIKCGPNGVGNPNLKLARETRGLTHESL